MDTWQGNWEFKNPLRVENGRTGTATASAPDAGTAREEIKKKASQQLFGMPTVQLPFFVVTGLFNVTKAQH
jgi:hypothetical protein